ncbi:MAG: hypothetical protein FJ271_16615 [Planctomycetes bacterium]|nr:hypothetical protein [Planctomycetota bacterium]
MRHPRLLALAQLVRLPNVFTVWADIGMGALVTGALPEQIVPFGFVLLASTCLYWAGMVWNDYFDVEQDAKERSFRPLPSGRIKRSTASIIGVLLITAGLACAMFADILIMRTALPLLAGCLAMLILAYDYWLKRTWLGPVAMGGCRFFNILLGLSLVRDMPAGVGITLALVVGTYIAGVTWFARTEARTSKQNLLLAAAGVMLAALLLSLTVPGLAENQGVGTTRTSPFFPYLLVAFGFYVGMPLSRAIANPQPARVQAAVKRSLLGLILLDAILATALAGTEAIVLAVLVFPAIFLGRWLYST